MSDNGREPTELWYRASAKNLVIFVLIWCGEAFLFLFLLKWLFPVSAALYWFMLPWTLLGLMMVLRPNWVTRFQRAVEKEVEREAKVLEKRRPSGFP